MINFLVSNNFELSGNTNRYNDFFTFLKDHSIEYSLNDLDFSNYDCNIIDLKYCKHHNNEFNIASNCKFFCGFTLRLIELAANKYDNREFIFDNIMTHNFDYSRRLNGTFFPMFIHKWNKIIRKPKYKYGMFVSSNSDVNYITIEDDLKTVGIDIENVLFLDREKYFTGRYATTQDTNLFLSSIHSFVDIANDYAMRHVMSRTYLEVINSKIPIYIISHNNSHPISLLGFKHIEYDELFKYNDIRLLKVKYNKKYFLTDSYKTYIMTLMDFPYLKLKYESAEEYAD